MKRQILLIVVSFAVLLTVFLFYRSVSRRWEALEATRSRPSEPESVDAGTDPVEAQVGKFLYVESRDENGTLRELYQAAKSQKQPDGSYLLTKPRIELYRSSGNGAVIQADSGTIWVEPAAGGFEVSRATLEGNVLITVDITPLIADWPSQPADALVDIYVDQIEFDTDLLSLTTDGPVTVVSKVADLKGRGLSVSWDEEPNELRSFRIEAAEYITLYSVPEDVTDSVSVSAAGDAQSLSEEPSVPATTGGIVAAETAPAASGEPKARNIYQATFVAGDQLIEIEQGERSIRGLDKLVLTFQWPQDKDDRSDQPPAEDGETPVPAEQQPGPAEAVPPKDESPEPMHIALSGPVIVEPIGYTDNPSGKNYSVTGKGQRVVMTEASSASEDTKVVCSEFYLSRAVDRADTGWMKAVAGQALQITIADDQEISCQMVQFAQENGQRFTYLHGPGEMIALEAGSAEDGPADEPDKITWQGRLRVQLAKREVLQPDGTMSEQTVIDEAIFYGPTQMTQAGGKTHVSCLERMEVQMAETKAGKVYPSVVKAFGGVQGRQANAEIAADQVTLEFDPPDEMAQPGDAGYGRPVRKSLKAQGKVSLTQVREDRTLVAQCDELVADLLGDSAVMIGAPAVVSQDVNRLEGRQISLSRTVDEDDPARTIEHVSVEGSGKLEFRVDQDKEGNELKDPRDVEVTWADGMTYNSAEDMVRLWEDVELTSQDESLTCDSMWLYLFDEVEKTELMARSDDEPAAAEAVAEPADPLGLEMGGFSQKRIDLIVADGNVVLQSKEMDPHDQLLWRVHMEGPKLNYDVPQRRAAVEGEGTFLVEDYRPPKEVREGRSTRLAAGSQRPRRALFRWKKSMEFSRADRSVLMTGDVLMRYRSGNRVEADWLKSRPWWPTVTTGRRMDLTCQTMMAEFAKPDEPDSTASEAGPIASGPSLADLEMFSATKDVRLIDGDRQRRELTGQRLLYKRSRRLATIWGYLLNQPEAPARLIYQDLDKGVATPVISPVINIFLSIDDEIVRVERIESPRGLHGWGGG